MLVSSQVSFIVANQPIYCCSMKGKKEMKNLRIKGWNMFFAFGLVFASLFALAPAQLAQADAGGVKGHTFVVTFIKWGLTNQTNPPSMAGVLMQGVVGGAVGEGKFKGMVISDDFSIPNVWQAHAHYGFYGEEHNLVADVHVRENDLLNPPKAVLTGVILSGWLKGSHFTGEYSVLPVCPIPTPGNTWGTMCVQGSLQIHVGGGSEH
jgi:hypothetical protein